MTDHSAGVIHRIPANRRRVAIRTAGVTETDSGSPKAGRRAPFDEVRKNWIPAGPTGVQFLLQPRIRLTEVIGRVLDPVPPLFLLREVERLISEPFE